MKALGVCQGLIVRRHSKNTTSQSPEKPIQKNSNEDRSKSIAPLMPERI